MFRCVLLNVNGFLFLMLLRRFVISLLSPILLQKVSPADNF